jgi:ribosomal protein S20
MEKTKYTLISRNRNTQQKSNVKTINRSFEHVIMFKYFGMTVINRDSIHEEVKSTLNLGNACYNSVQNLLAFRLLSRNVKIEMYKTTILPVGVYGYKI